MEFSYREPKCPITLLTKDRFCIKTANLNAPLGNDLLEFDHLTFLMARKPLGTPAALGRNSTLRNPTGETIFRLGNRADGCQSRISHLAPPTSTCTGDPVPGREGRTQPGAAEKMTLKLWRQGPEEGAGSKRPSARLSPACAKRGCFRNQIRAAFRNFYCNLPGINFLSVDSTHK